MLADTDRYFRQLTDYRLGEAVRFIRYVADAALHASELAEESAARFAELPQRWRDATRSRANSGDEASLDRLLDVPIFNADIAQQTSGTTDASTSKALDRLSEAGVLKLLSSGARNRIWAASDVLAELDTLAAVFGQRSTL
jgi:Fic family protein